VSDLGRATLLHALDVATRAFLAELGRGDPALADRLGEPLSTLLMSGGRDSAGST
jgi:hypothetical protein